MFITVYLMSLVITMFLGPKCLTMSSPNLRSFKRDTVARKHVAFALIISLVPVMNILMAILSCVFIISGLISWIADCLECSDWWNQDIFKGKKK